MEREQNKHLQPFKNGDDKRRNTTGENKGSGWRKNLLKNLLAMDVGDENQEFNMLKAKYPKLFNGSEEKNLQLFMEIKQVSLVFSDNEQVAQNAIKEIKDRIDGKATQEHKVTEERIDLNPFEGLPEEKIEELLKDIEIAKGE